MDPLSIIALTNAAISLLEKSLPIIDGLKQNGEVTPEQQAELLARYESLKATADGQFSGAHWQVTPPPSIESPIKGD